MQSDASFLGMEIFMPLISLDLSVTIIEIDKRVLSHLESQTVSNFFKQYAEEQGASVLLCDTASASSSSTCSPNKGPYPRT